MAKGKDALARRVAKLEAENARLVSVVQDAAKHSGTFVSIIQRAEAWDKVWQLLLDLGMDVYEAGTGQEVALKFIRKIART